MNALRNGMPALPVQHFFAGTVRGLVEAQRALDERARESLVRWEEEGVPPTVWIWSGCRLTCSVDWACSPKTDHADRTVLGVSPAEAGRGSLGVRLRYIPAPQVEGEHDGPARTEEKS